MIVGLEKIKLNRAFSILLLVFVFSVIFSCENDFEDIKRVTETPGTPEERTQNLELIYSDSGVTKIFLKAKLAESYYSPVHKIVFKDGVNVRFYNPDGTVKTILTSKYGEILQDDGNMIARDSVCMKNVNKNQKLETEELVWNQKTQEVKSSKAVIVKTKGGVFFGDGIKTTSDFSQYEFVKPRGTIGLNN